MPHNRPSSAAGLGFWPTTLAGILSALAVGLGTWLLGYWPAFWSWFVPVLVAAWSWLAYPVPVPAAVLIVLAIVIVAMRRKKPILVSGSSATQAPPKASSRSIQLAATENGVVALLAEADGHWLTIEQLASALQTSRLATERSLEKLMARGFLLDRHNMIHGTSFRLSSSGRDFALDSHVGGGVGP